MSEDELFCYFTNKAKKKKLSLKVRKSASNFFGDSLLPMITMQVSSDSVDSLF